MIQYELSRIWRKMQYRVYYYFIGRRIFNNGEILDGKRFWLISDMHFNHENVRKWCRNDVFKNVKEMNTILIKNWNDTVNNFDMVYCIGDFGPFGFRWQLRGRISILKGNHDRKNWDIQKVIRYRDLKFLVIHDPGDPKNPTNWFDGDWIIHGHKHKDAPFIDIRRKRINVSCEAVNYKPISMEELYSIVQESKKYLKDRWVR